MLTSSKEGIIKHFIYLYITCYRNTPIIRVSKRLFISKCKLDHYCESEYTVCLLSLIEHGI